MGLQDFWDNIRTPGFIDNMFEELGDLCKEAKTEMVSLMEEGEEVFIDGFREMVIKENPEYKNSVQKKEAAKLLIDDIRSQLLAARGVTDGSSSYILGIVGLSLKNAATALAELDRKKIDAIISSLQTDYENLAILNPEELFAFSDRIRELLKLPDAPQYIHPYSEREATFLDADLRKQRVDAADKFLSASMEYAEIMKGEVSKQIEVGILFDHSNMEGEACQLLEKCERYLCIENMSLKFLAENEEALCENDWLVVRSALLLSAAIYSIAHLALVALNGDLNSITDGSMIDLKLGMDEVGSRKKGYFLAQYLSDVEEVNSRAISSDVDHDELNDK